MKITETPADAEMVELRITESDLVKAAEIISQFKVKPRIIPRLKAGVMSISCLAEKSADEVHLLSATKYGARTFIDDPTPPEAGDLYFIVPKGSANRLKRVIEEDQWKRDKQKTTEQAAPMSEPKKAKKKKE